MIIALLIFPLPPGGLPLVFPMALPYSRGGSGELAPFALCLLSLVTVVSFHHAATRLSGKWKWK